MIAPRGATRGRSLLAAAAAGALVLTMAGCGSDGGDSTAPSTTASAADPASDTTLPAYQGSDNAAVAAAAALLPAADPNQALPPNDVGSLRRLYGPALATFGLRLTRGELIDTTNGGYDPSNSGTHLALYVEPIDGTYAIEDYVEGLWSVSALVTPDVFSRWSGIESYDICQEPPPGVDDSDEPLPYTQINLTREVAEGIDWANGDTATLLAAARASNDFDLVIAKEVRVTPEYRSASHASKAMGSSTTTTTS